MNQQLDTNEDENKKGENKREGFKMAFRRRLFQIYFELMRERNIDSIFACVVLLINFLQIYGLLFNHKIEFPFHDSIYNTVCNLSNIVRVYPLLGASDGLYYWVLAYFFIFIMVIYVLSLIFIDYSIKIEKFYFVFPIKILRYLSTFIQWILLQPIVEVFISIFSCENGYHVMDITLECWSGMHIFYCILFSICLMIFFVIFLLINFFYNESRPYHTDAFARLDTNFETYLSLYRTFICIVGHFLYQDKLHWLIIAIHIIGSANFCKMYLKYLPYYNYRTSVLFGSGWFAYFWISLNVLLTKALESIHYEGQIIVIIIGLILIYPATQQIREYKIQKKIFTKKHDKIKSEYELDIFIHKLYRLIIDQIVNEVDEMVLLGIVHNHQSECLNSECPLNSQEELYLPLNDSISDRKALYSKDPILLYHLINSIYAEYAKSSNSTAVLHTTYAYFLFYQIGNIHTALLELNVAEKCDTNYQQKFTIYRAKRFIENYLVTKFGKSKEAQGKQTFHDMDVTIVITFESLYAKLNKEIEKSANDHIEFWSHLDSQMVDLNVLHKLGLNIITNTKRINDIWHQLCRINSNYPKALQIYGNYLVQIKNDNNEGEEFLAQAGLMTRPKSLDEHVNDFEMMFADDTAIVVISGNKDSQAKIMKTNNGITKLFGYNTFEVHGHEVNILMPPIIGVKHNYFLEQFFKTGRERVINSDLDSFAMLRLGHIFSITLIVKPVPSLKNDIQYIGLIKPTNKDYDFILTDQYGRIDSISKGITNMLHLQSTFFKENEIFIQVLCPQLCEAERIKGTKEYSTKFDIWNGVRDLTFIIPKNFSNLTQKTGSRGIQNAQNINTAANNNMMYDNDDDRGKEPAFVGLKSPDHLKKVCNMFRNQDFKSQPAKYMQNLKQNINYDQPEVSKGPVKCEIINKSHGNGHLQMKVFKILNPKRAGSNDESDSERDMTTNQGNKNLRAMLEDAFKKLIQKEVNADDLSRKLVTMRTTLLSMKKGQRHPSTKYKPSNIATANIYEKAEIQKYSKQIKELEEKLQDIKKREQEEKLALEEEFKDNGARRLRSSMNVNQDDLLKEDANIDYERIKDMYPLRENANQPMRPLDISLPSIAKPSDITYNDVSAFQDESMMQERALIGNREDNQDDLENKSNNAHLFEDMENFEDMGGMDRPRFKEDDEKLDLLKDIRKKQNDKKKNKKEEGKEGENEEGNGESTNEGTENEEQDEHMVEEDNGSVVSSTKSLMKHLRMLRNALYENYSPPSIRNLKLQAKIVFIVLMIITVTWYVYSEKVYQKLKENIENVHASKYRMSSLTNIAADVRILTMMQQGRISAQRGGKDYETYKRNDLDLSAQLLQKAQTNLSETYLKEDLDKEDENLINPDYIKIIQDTPCALPYFFYVDVWSAMMQVAVHAYSVQDMPLSNITISEAPVFYILTNSFNNLLDAIQSSMQAILDETQKLSVGVKNTLKILLYVASGSLLISLCLIFPVATKVDKNKDELLRHFMLIDRDDVKRQLEKCRVFFNTMHDKEHVTQQNAGDMEDEEFKDEEVKEGEEGDGQHKYKKGARQRSRKNKMHKKFSTNFLSLIIKFLVVVTVLEGYFLLNFFLSGTFLKIANSIINESGTIAIRQFSNNFLYQIMQEVLTTNGKALIHNQDSVQYVFGYLNQTIKDQEAFLKQHSNNAAYHSASFLSFFDELIYQNVCDAIYKDTDPDHRYDSCNTFMGGILKKGLYSANVAYWDNMRSIATDYNNSPKDLTSINNLLNTDRLINNENLKDIYFADAYTKLLSMLDESILYRFHQKDREDTILFACYIVILFLLYFIIWDRFVEATRHSLYVTKSMLAIIPLEIIQKVPKIKDFLLAQSKTNMSAFKD